MAAISPHLVFEQKNHLLGKLIHVFSIVSLKYLFSKWLPLMFPCLKGLETPTVSVPLLIDSYFPNRHMQCRIFLIARQMQKLIHILMLIQQLSSVNTSTFFSISLMTHRIQ